MAQRRHPDRLMLEAPLVSAGGDPPLVTVITIFRNANERFFAEAIQSVIAQTWQNWELLLVDDGSSDGSSAFARGWAAREPERIRYLEHPGHAHRGMSASRQAGVDGARGEFIAFLDADDLFLPDKLERQLALLRARPQAAMVFGPSLHWHSWTGRPEDAARDVGRRLGVPPETLVTPPTLVRAFLGRTADTPATCATLIRRAAIVAVGGFDASFVDLFEDQAFFYRLALRFPIYAEASHRDLYRRHPDSVCETAIRAGIAADDYRPTPARANFLRWLEAEFQRCAVRDAELHRLLQAELWPYRHPLLHRVVAAGRQGKRFVGRGPVGRMVWRLLRARWGTRGSARQHRRHT